MPEEDSAVLTTLLLTITLAQVPQVDAGVPAPSLGTTSERILTPAEQRQAELKRLVEKRRQRHASGMARKQQALGQLRTEVANREAQAAALQAQAGQQQALQNLAAAEQRRAAIAEAQYRLNSQVAGAPQILVPGEGMVPYANGVAPPWWWGLQQARPIGQPPVELAK